MQQVATFLIFFSLSNIPAFARDAVLEIRSGTTKLEFTREALLHNPKLETITVEKEVHTLKPFTFQAVPVTSLFKGITIAKGAEIEFVAEDGFAAPIERERLLNESETKSRAYIAVEDPAHPWPSFIEGLPSPGPFYLVWVKPELSHIVLNEWPTNLLRFEVKGRFDQTYPLIIPHTSQKSILNGFLTFRNNCFACHQVNHQGASMMGPDLNLPMNPIEYFKPAVLKKYIRDPESVRKWQGQRMPGFSKAEISDSDLNNLVRYLAFISKVRPSKSTNQ